MATPAPTRPRLPALQVVAPSESVDLGGQSLTDLADAIRSRTATVAVVGLGYVGLPLLVALAEAGFPVVGIDVDARRVQSLITGIAHVADSPDATLPRDLRARFTTDPHAMREADVVIVTVPTPLTDGVPDLSAVREACADVAANLGRGRLVVLESTTYPGTTDEVVLPILQESGLSVGTDFALAYSPERVDPGSSWGVTRTPKIVSGIDDLSADLAELLYEGLVPSIVRTPSTREAEMAKLIENTFRHVNIALINELTTVAPSLGVDIWSALEAAATKPFGFMPFWPGPGVGGHCIAIDPSYLSWRIGQRLGFGLGFVEHANQVNKRMPAYVVSRIGQALNEALKPIRGSRVMAIGVPYKAGVSDLRESPSIAVMEHLSQAGADVSFHDPFVERLTLRGMELRSRPLDPWVLRSQDCVAILTAHPDIDYQRIVSLSPLVFDTRGVTRGLGAHHVVLL